MGDDIFTAELVRQILISSVVSYGVVAAVKPALSNVLAANWKRSALRTLALVVGGLSGWLIGGDLLHSMAGVGGGAMSAVLVAAVKSVIQKRLGVDASKLDDSESDASE